MTIRHVALSGALITTLLLTACNPIPPEPSPLTTLPARPRTPEPMQANLHDFAFAFAEIFDEEIKPEAYADAISKIDNCMRSQAAAAEVDPYDPYTPGQAAAIQWVSILMLTTNMDSEIFEDIKPHIPNFYNRLIQLHEFCMED